MSAVRKSNVVNRTPIALGASATIGFDNVGWQLQVVESTLSTVPVITGTVNGAANVSLGEADGIVRCNPGKITVTASVAACVVEWRAVVDISGADQDAINYMWPPVGDDPANTGSSAPTAKTAYFNRYTVQGPAVFSGVSFAVGGTSSGTSKATVVVYDNDGVLLGSSAVAGTTVNSGIATTMSIQLTSKIVLTQDKTLWVGVVFGDNGTHYGTRKSFGYSATYANLCDPAAGTAPATKITLPAATGNTTPYKIGLA